MNLRSLALASCSGLLLAASFPSFNLHSLAWVALVPLLMALHKESVEHAFLLGAVCGMVFFAVTVHWVANSIHIYGNLSVMPAALITLLLSSYLALYPALFAAGMAYLSPYRTPVLFLAAPALWTSLELARTFLFSGFPWALLGYSQYEALPVIQIADVTGVYGVSFLIVLVNTAIVQLIADKRILPILAALLVTALVLGYGVTRLKTPIPEDGIRISLIQGNIEQDKKWDRSYQRETFSTYVRLTRKALGQNPDLVIWPETSVPFYFGSNDPVARDMSAELSTFVAAHKVPLLFGSPTYDSGSPAILHNSAFLLSGDGKVAAVYRKLHLVPFGEYVPLKSVLFFVEKMVESEGEFEPGSQFTVMSISGAREKNVGMNTVICYEIIFPDLVRRFVDRGARIITTITNDAWFGKTAAPYQHFSMAVFRAVENRVPVARAANTGVSGFIDAHGRILSSSGIFTEDVRTETVAPGRTRTFYTAYGDIFSYLCIAATLILLLRARTQAP